LFLNKAGSHPSRKLTSMQCSRRKRSPGYLCRPKQGRDLPFR
jgi:hypothetical protein